MRVIRSLHKWIALLAGLQMLLWLASGLVMSLLDHHVVSGESVSRSESVVHTLGADERIVEPLTLMQNQAGKTIRDVELQRHPDRWVWRVRTDAGTTVYDAATGDEVEVEERTALAIAAADYAGDAKPRSAMLLTGPTMEARDHAGPIWRVEFPDAQQTRYYVDAADGRILERRTGDWRVFDIFWMLHTMDYRGRDDFNHPLVVTFAFSSVWLALTGVLLLFRRGRANASNIERT